MRTITVGRLALADHRQRCRFGKEIMKIEDFKSLTEDEQSAFLKLQEDQENRITDLEAERDSFKSENEKLRADFNKNREELKKTKELNFTLARRMDNSADKKSAEEIMNDLFN